MIRFVLPMAAIAVAGLLLSTGARPAHAICVAKTPEEYVQAADIIITGTVSQMDIVPPLDEESPDDLVHTLQATFAVDEYLKGSGPHTLTILEPSHTFLFDDEGVLMGRWVEDGVFYQESAGKYYILFLQGEVDSLATHACSGSRILDQQFLEDVHEAIAAVEALPPTGSAPAGDRSGETAPWLPIIVGSSLGLTLLAGGGWFTLRARRRA